MSFHSEKEGWHRFQDEIVDGLLRDWSRSLSRRMNTSLGLLIFGLTSVQQRVSLVGCVMGDAEQRLRAK